MTTTSTAQERSTRTGSVDTGRLVFTRGAAHLTIGVKQDHGRPLSSPLRGEGAGRQDRRRRLVGPLPHEPASHEWRDLVCGGIPWSIRGHMGMSHVVADLEELELTDLEVSAGMSHVEMRLPRPKQTVRIRIGGGASDVELIGPTGVPVRVHIGGGASTLAIDEFRLDSGSGTDWRSPDYDRVEPRYDIGIRAGASKLTVRT